jgi:UDP-N-acetylmuramyl tripeptide synthase
LQFLEEQGLLSKINLAVIEFKKKSATEDEVLEYILEIIQTKIDELAQEEFEKIKWLEFLNPHKMTMIDPINLQKDLKTMKGNGCEAVIIEVSSQGLEQNRHWGLPKFDYGMFINLYPEHIESHGSFEKYKLAKSKLFSNVKEGGVVVGNGNDPHTEEMLSHAPNPRTIITIQKDNDYSINPVSSYIYKDFVYGGANIASNFVADFEVQNAVLAGTLLQDYLTYDYGFDFDKSLLEKNYFQIPGRMEWVVVDNKVV